MFLFLFRKQCEHTMLMNDKHFRVLFQYQIDVHEEIVINENHLVTRQIFSFDEKQTESFLTLPL